MKNGCPTDLELRSFVKIVHLHQGLIKKREPIGIERLKQINKHLKGCAACRDDALIVESALKVVYPEISISDLTLLVF